MSMEVLQGPWPLLRRERRLFDAFGAELVLTAMSAPEPMLTIGRGDQGDGAAIVLGPSAARAVAAFLALAPLSVPDPLPHELVPGSPVVRLELLLEPVASIQLVQGEVTVVLPASSWTRLAAEIALAIALLDAGREHSLRRLN